MLVGYQLFVAAVLLLGPGVVGDCVNCNQYFGFHCRVNQTGYFCKDGATIYKSKLLPEVYIAKSDLEFRSCTPSPYVVEYVNTFCCFFSPELGCQLAINHGMLSYQKEPISRCMDCSSYCDCENDRVSGSTSFQSLTVFFTLGSLALSLLSSLIWRKRLWVRSGLPQGPRVQKTVAGGCEQLSGAFTVVLAASSAVMG